MSEQKINFFSENDFQLEGEEKYQAWLAGITSSEAKELGEINYIFCDDEYLHKINVDYLNHDTYTDIISFDYTSGNLLSGDIYISTERVVENAQNFDQEFQTELLRVMAHGLLHLCGYKDKSESESRVMRQKEEEKIQMFHVEQ
ncbi:rRNA maturation RNase YbeY [Salegentibacter sp. HM20]